MRVELRDIHKSFGPVRANDGISLTAEAGSVRALLGENGAGKSTLMKILSGFTAPDRGQILLDGAPVRIASPAEALRLGIGMLHQDPLDFPRLSVLDNFLMGRPVSRHRHGLAGLVPDRRGARDALRALAAQFAFSLDPDAPCAGLSAGERQQLGILRLLWLGVRVLILDEPTTAISEPQRVKLFAALRTMTGQGQVVFFVSHKLQEVLALCDAVTVLRAGRVAGDVTAPCDPGRLVELMFGRELPHAPRIGITLGPPVLELAALTIDDARSPIAHVSLRVRAGEAIGLAGLEGSGQRLFLQACAGLIPPAAGRVSVAGRDLTGRPYREFLASGVAYVPAGRLGEALIPGLTVADHLALAERPGVFVDWHAASRAAAQRIGEYNVRGTPRTPVQELSGGNQQRVLLALLPEQIAVLLMEHPTRGLDVESAQSIWSHVLERRRRGTAVLFSSSDLDELLERSDRILVFFSGRVSAPLDARRATVEQLGRLMAGDAPVGRDMQS
ncbi:MAG: ATP-binding cassette domain-containing protein [Bacillati bacterium ANGP1]|uniref:ATP-binding cassette domain-containing protein n=1 Tax=Candidatus Segetimicrobium genomatis TaxID=2569760 RepID=A0A537J6I5_9BACT|nr:MAG: ATP-binding cassette domain-containing protein [Terrabacteria group bacterium ANGP1]